MFSVTLVERTKSSYNFYVPTTFKFALQIYFVVDPVGVEPTTPSCRDGILPLDYGPFILPTFWKNNNLIPHDLKSWEDKRP